MRNYPIWNDVTACIYKSSKSFGAKKKSQQKVLVGTSKNNSHQLASITTEKVVNEEDDTTTFEFCIDGRLVKSLTMCNKTHETFVKTFI